MTHATKELTDSVGTHLGALDPATRKRLCEALGLAPQRATSGASAVAAALAAREPAIRAVRTLPAGARALVYVLAAPHAETAGFAEADRLLADARGFSADDIRAAHRDALASGLVRVEGGWRASVLPGLAEAIGGDTFDWHAGAVGDEAPPLPYAHVLAAVACYCVENPPRLRTDGRLYVKWPEKCAERLGAAMVPPARAEHLAHRLGLLGLLEISDDGDRRELAVAASAIDPVFGQSPADLAYADLGSAGDAALAARLALGALVRAGRAQEGGGAVSRGSLLGALPEFAESLRAIGAHDESDIDADPMALAQGLRFLREFGMAEFVPGTAEPSFRRIEPAGASGAGRWIVQPNLDVLVPEDVPPAAVARLGLVASVVRIDRVSTFTISRESVRRGSARGGRGHDPLAILAAHSALPVPENVVATVRDWARRPREIRTYVGAVVVAETEEQAAHLRASAATVREIAPSAFLIRPDDVKGVIVVAANAGFATAAVETAAGPTGTAASRSDLPLHQRAAAAAATARATLDRLIAATPRPRGRSLPRRTAGPPAASDLPTLGEVTTTQIWEFRAKWPRIYAAVASDPDLLALAVHMPREMLGDLALLARADRIRDALALARAEAFLERFDAAGAEHGGPHGPDCTCDDDGGAHAPFIAPKQPSVPRSPAAPPVPAIGRPWETPPPGELRRRLADGAAAKSWIDVLYVNSQDVRATRTVRPLRIHDGARPAVEVEFRDAPGSGRILLERIAAVRATE